MDTHFQFVKTTILDSGDRKTDISDENSKSSSCEITSSWKIAVPSLFVFFITLPASRDDLDGSVPSPCVLQPTAFLPPLCD